MSLLGLPNELFWPIMAELLDSENLKDSDLNSVVCTCQFFYKSFNDILYERKLRRDDAYAVILHAAQMGHACSIQRLLQISDSGNSAEDTTLLINPNPSPTSDDWSPLLGSAIQGDENVTRLLLSLDGIDVDIKSPTSQRTPLSIAAEQGFVDVVRLLLTSGANPNIRDRFMRTPLHWAGSPQLTGERPETYPQNVFRKWAQDPKVDYESKYCCPSLAAYSEVDIIGSARWNSVHSPEDAHRKPFIQPNSTSTPWSAGANYKETLDLLVQYGAQLELEDCQGLTPLTWAARCRYQPLVEFLVHRRRSPPSSKPELENLARGERMERDYKKSALSYAAQNGHSDVVESLLERSTQRGTLLRDALCLDPGWAPLMWAAQGCHTDIVKLLLSEHAKRWPEQSLGSKTAAEAARHGRTHIIPLLAEAGAGFEGSQVYDFMTPLHLAAMNMHADTVKCLLDIPEVDVNHVDKHGWTALDWAARGQCTLIKDMLVDRGASPSTSRTVDELANPPHALCTPISSEPKVDRFNLYFPDWNQVFETFRQLQV